MKNIILGLIIGLSIITSVFYVGISNAQTGNISETANTSYTNTSNSGDDAPISISIPVEKGYVNGNVSYFISTDASEEMIVSSVTNTTKFKVNYAPTLSNTSEISRQQGYVFVNGVIGNGTFDHQLPVASASGGDPGYSPLFEINYVEWNNNTEPRVLKSVSEILEAEANGELSIEKSNIVINSPAVEIK